MPDVKDVINGLEICTTAMEAVHCPECKYKTLGGLCKLAMMRDALALLKAQEQKCRECGEATSKAIQELQTKLKAQEPRTMTWQEVIGAAIECKPLYIEVKDSEDKEPGDDRWAMVTQYKDSITNGMIRAMSSYITIEILFKDLYGKTWRCWSSRPDEKRRAETPWN